MMEDSLQVQVIFYGDIKTTSKECSTLNRSLTQRYKISLQESSNTTSNFILKDILKQHGDMMDDQSSSGVDNLSGQINNLLPNKNMYKNCSQWKSSLRDSNKIAFFLNKNVYKCTKPTCVNPGIPKEVFDTFNCHLKKINLDKDIGNSTLKRPHPSESNNQNSLYLNSDQKKFSLNKTVTNSNTFLENSNNIQERPSFMKKAETYTHSKQPLQEQPRNVTNLYSRPAPVDQKTLVSNKIMKNAFKTAREELIGSNPILKKSLGISRVTQSKFLSPMMGVNTPNAMEVEEVEPEISDERLKHIDPKMIELIQSEIIDSSAPLGWDDIAGLEMAKSVIQEAVVWPLMRPDIFTGLRRPPKGILLFGPPGTGKTLIGKCVASQCSATFFSISASSLTSKWIGDGEKMVRALFAVAKCHQPAVIFIDEIDSLLTQRSDAEHEATRRIKTEFLVQLDGAGTADEERLLIIGATNRPQELDEAARRRLVKRLYIPLPDLNARRQIISNLMRNERHELVAADMVHVAELTSGFSGADMRSLCSEAAMGPVRQVPLSQMVAIHTDMVRAVSVDDFKTALQRVRPSVSADDLGQYVRWNQTYGLGCHS